MFFRKKKTVDYQTLISILEQGNKEDVRGILWQPKGTTVDYLPVTYSLIEKLKKPLSSDTMLTISQQIENGDFELVIFSIPWTTSDVPYTPLVIHKPTEKIVGIMLPFNELHGHITERESKRVAELGVKWTKFVMEFRFNVKL
jgi:hypothetical protein